MSFMSFIPMILPLISNFFRGKSSSELGGLVDQNKDNVTGILGSVMGDQDKASGIFQMVLPLIMSFLSKNNGDDIANKIDNADVNKLGGLSGLLSGGSNNNVAVNNEISNKLVDNNIATTNKLIDTHISNTNELLKQLRDKAQRNNGTTQFDEAKLENSTGLSLFGDFLFKMQNVIDRLDKADSDEEREKIETELVEDCREIIRLVSV